MTTVESKYGSLEVNSDGKIDWNKSKMGVTNFIGINRDKTELERVTEIGRLFPLVCQYIFREYESETFKGGQGQEIKRVPSLEEFNPKHLALTGLPWTVIDGKTIKIAYRTYSPTHIDSTFAIIGISFEIIK